MSQARDYISNNFTEVEKELFDFLVNSFPEYMLIDEEGEEQEDVLALLGILAKVFGNLREHIFNLETRDDLVELYRKIDEEYLADPNTGTGINIDLLLLLVDELSIPLFENKDREEALDLLKDKNIRLLVLDSYLIKRGRGTEESIKAIVKYLINYSLKSKGVDPSEKILITEPEIILEPTSTNIFIDSSIYETYLDQLATDKGYAKDLEGNIIFSMAGKVGFYLKETNELYKYLIKYKPAGVFYGIIVSAVVNFFFNSIDDRVFRGIEDNSFSLETLSTSIVIPTVDSLHFYLNSSSSLYKYITRVKVKNTSVFSDNKVQVLESFDGSITPFIVPMLPKSEEYYYIYTTKSTGEVQVSFSNSIGSSSWVSGGYPVEVFEPFPLTPLIVSTLGNNITIYNPNNCSIEVNLYEKWLEDNNSVYLQVGDQGNYIRTYHLGIKESKTFYRTNPTKDTTKNLNLTLDYGFLGSTDGMLTSKVLNLGKIGVMPSSNVIYEQGLLFNVDDLLIYHTLNIGESGNYIVFENTSNNKIFFSFDVLYYNSSGLLGYEYISKNLEKNALFSKEILLDSYAGFNKIVVEGFIVCRSEAETEQHMEYLHHHREVIVS